MQWPKSKNEINWGTVIGIAITLIPLCIAGIVWIVSVSNRSEENHRIFLSYQAQHADLHKDRNVAIETALTDLRARLSVEESSTVKQQLSLDNHEWRTTTLEAGAANLATTVSEIKTEMGEIKADIRLTNQRLEQVIGLLGGTPRGQQ